MNFKCDIQIESRWNTWTTSVVTKTVLLRFKGDFRDNHVNCSLVEVSAKYRVNSTIFYDLERLVLPFFFFPSFRLSYFLLFLYIDL